MIFKDKETRESILAGAEMLYDAVRTTLGPKGRNVIVKDKFGNFSLTHDGVTVARAVKSDDPKIQLGIDMIKSGSVKMEGIGDGTTTVTVLSYHLIKHLSDLVAAGTNPMQIRRELPDISNRIVQMLDKQVQQIPKTKEGVYSVAYISSADKELAEGIAELVVGTGYDGAINVESSNDEATHFDLTDGFVYPGTFAHPVFITDPRNRSSTLTNAAVIAINGDITGLDKLIPLIDQLINQNTRSMILICNSIGADALNVLLTNKARGTFNCTVIKNFHGRGRLEDLAAYTGAQVMEADAMGFDHEKVGRAKKVVIKSDEVIISGYDADFSEYLQGLKHEMVDNKTPELEERIQFLKGKVGSIEVGGLIDTEVQDKKYRIDDAVAATRAALKDGILPGGGIALRDVAAAMEQDSPVVSAVISALNAPHDILLENSGIEVNFDKPFKYGVGTDVMVGDDVDMLKAGIVDPAGVTIGAVQNAFAVAADTISIGGAVVEPAITQQELATVMGASQQL